MLTPGQVLDGRYEILGPIARGGMGEVYRARRTLLGDEVAIKVIHPAATDAGELRERFLRESRACAHLRHPNIVSILDFDLGPDGSPFLVMEMLNGPSLRDEIRRQGRIPLSSAQPIVTAVAGAIQLAHDRGVVHRDLKPSNIVSHRFQTGEVVWKIIDFGLANLREGSDSTRLTAARDFIGTVTYAPPEQLRGESVDYRADIYSLGAVAFEMLTGRPPFPTGDLLAVVSQHLTAAPPAPSAVAPDLPAFVDAVVLKALEKDPARRWQRVSELAIALGGGADEPPATATASRPPPLPSWLDKYELERSLGRGRLGSEIFAGRHRALGLPVAVRVARRSTTTNWDAVRARFLQEARALQAPHPSVLQVRDFGEEDGVIYLVTDLVEGTSLRELLARDAPLAWPRLERLVRQLLDAAAALHRRGGVLSGLSPEIIRMTRDDDGERLLISTAGISQVQDLLSTLDEQTLRGAGMLDPEVPYVAPEVFVGRTPDQRSDVFTLGVLMYEMATGRLPFQAFNMHQLVGAALSMRPVDPRDLQAGLPDPFAEMTLRCLRSNPDERPSGPAEALDALG